MSKRSANEGGAAQQAKLSKLEPSDTYEEALKIVYKMQETTLAHAMILTLVRDEPDDLRCGALKVLEKLEPAALAQHASVLGAALTRSRQSALTRLHNNPEFISWRRKLSCAWQSVSRRSG